MPMGRPVSIQESGGPNAYWRGNRAGYASGLAAGLTRGRKEAPWDTWAKAYWEGFGIGRKGGYRAGQEHGSQEGRRIATRAITTALGTLGSAAETCRQARAEGPSANDDCPAP